MWQAHRVCLDTRCPGGSALVRYNSLLDLHKRWPSPTKRIRILGTEGATIPADPTQEATVTLLTTTNDTPSPAGLALSSIADLASSATGQGGTRLSHGSEMPLSGSLTVGPHGDLIISQVSSSEAASAEVTGSGQISRGGCARHIPATSVGASADIEEIVIEEDEEEEEEEELEDMDTDSDDEYSPAQLLQKATLCTKRVGNEGQDEDYDPTGYKKSDIIRFLRNPLFMQDSDGAQEVRGRLLGLEQGARPDKHQVNRSPIFRLRPPPPNKEKVPLTNVSEYWIDILNEEGALGDRHPKEYQPPEGYGKLYTWEGIRKHCPTALNAWKDEQVPGSLILLVPALASGTRIGGDYDLSNFHEVKDSLKKATIGKGERVRKQFGFCVYCGVRYENQDTLYNHIRRHIGLEFMCESCLSTVSTSPKQMASHMDKCKAAGAAKSIKPGKPGRHGRGPNSHGAPTPRTMPNRKGKAASR